MANPRDWGAEKPSSPRMAKLDEASDAAKDALINFWSRFRTNHPQVPPGQIAEVLDVKPDRLSH